MAKFGRKVARNELQKKKSIRSAVAAESIAQIAATLQRDCVPAHLAHKEARRLLERTFARMHQERAAARSMNVAPTAENDDLHATILQREILVLIANWRKRLNRDPINPELLKKYGIQLDGSSYELEASTAPKLGADGLSLAFNSPVLPVSRAAQIGAAMDAKKEDPS